MSTIDDAFLAAESLGTDEKLQLISWLWESIPPQDWQPSLSDLTEIKRRSEDIDAGAVQTIPWEVVRDSVRQRLAANDSD